MRLKTKQASTPAHTELVGACGWSVWNELYSCSDDQTIHKWNLVGEPEGKVCERNRECRAPRETGRHACSKCMWPACHASTPQCLLARARLLAGVPAGCLLHRHALVSSQLKEEPGRRH